MKVKVRNLQSKKSSREVANQFVISVDGIEYEEESGIGTYPEFEDAEIFQSYKTVIAIKYYGSRHRTVLDSNALDYSKTTSRYLYEFLGEDRKQIQAKIKSGEYKTADLNAK